MAYCSSCGVEFKSSDLFASRCSACRREEESRVRREDEEAQREARREAAEEQRHRERLDADRHRQDVEEERSRKEREVEEDRIQAEDLRRIDQDILNSEYRRDRQREEREAQDSSWRDGSLGSPLDNAESVGRSYRNSGQGAKHRGNLQARIKLLVNEDSSLSFSRHQETVLREIVALGNSNFDLLAAYFDVANRWDSFPWSVNSVLAENNQLSLDLYRKLLAVYISRPGVLNSPGIYNEHFLALLLSLPHHDELVDRYLATSLRLGSYIEEKHFSIVYRLLDGKETRRANDLFVEFAKRIDQKDRPNMFYWRLCPLGIELHGRGMQPVSWVEKFQSSVKATEIGMPDSSQLKEIIDSKWMSPRTRALIVSSRDAVVDGILAKERDRASIELAKEDMKWYTGDGDGLNSPPIFAAIYAAIALGVSLYFDVSVSGAIFVSVAVGLCANWYKRNANKKLLKESTIDEKLRKIRAELAEKWP